MIVQFKAGLDPGHRLPYVGQCCATLEVIERFQLLYRVAFDTGANAVSNNRVKVDKHTGPKKVIYLILSGGVSSHEALQGGWLVRCIVVNVKVGMLHKARHHEVDKSFEGGFLGCPRQCPIGGVGDVCRLVDQRHNQRGTPATTADKRVTLEIEKDIARRGRRQDAKPKAWHHWQAFVNCAAFGTALNLNAGLLAHSLIGMGCTALGLPGQGRGRTARAAVEPTACLASSPIWLFDMPATKDR